MSQRRLAPPPAPSAPGVEHAEVPISDKPATGTRRSRSAVAGGALVVLVGALGGWALLSGAGDRTDVLAVARDVSVGAELTEADLRVVAVSETQGVATVPAGQRREVVGQRAAVGLAEGGLLAPGQVTDGPAAGVDGDVVAVELARGMGPVGMLDIGDTVLAVPVDETAGDDDVDDGGGPAGGSVEAEVVEIGRADAAGAAVVHLAVDERDSARLASWAAADQVALVLRGKGGQQ